MRFKGVAVTPCVSTVVMKTKRKKNPYTNTYGSKWAIKLSSSMVLCRPTTRKMIHAGEMCIHLFPTWHIRMRLDEELGSVADKECIV
jgi:hypothetical protein